MDVMQFSLSADFHMPRSEYPSTQQSNKNIAGLSFSTIFNLDITSYRGRNDPNILLEEKTRQN